MYIFNLGPIIDMVPWEHSLGSTDLVVSKGWKKYLTTWELEPAFKLNISNIWPLEKKSVRMWEVTHGRIENINCSTLYLDFSFLGKQDCLVVNIGCWLIPATRVHIPIAKSCTMILPSLNISKIKMTIND